MNLEFENRGKKSKFDKMDWVTEGLIYWGGELAIVL